MNYIPDASAPRRFYQPSFYEEDLLLMVDERLIASNEGARWEFCPLKKAESPLLLPTEPWEGGDGKNVRPVHGDSLDGSILWDAQEEKYMAWYRTHNRLLAPHSYRRRPGNSRIVHRQREGSPICLATSRDGLHWQKPELGAVYYQGSLRNNMVPVVHQNVLQEDICGVLPNYHNLNGPELIATTHAYYDDLIYPRGITHLSSHDGVHWNGYFPPPLPIDGDAHCLMWDAKSGCYLCTTRSAQHGRVIQRLRERGYCDLRDKRHVALAKSRDLIHWTPMLDVLEVDKDDPETAQIYTMYILPYGNLYLGFLEMFYMSSDMTYGPLETQLAISYDLDHWHRAGRRQPFLPLGEAGSWDQSHVRLFASPPFRSGDSLRFWYSGKDTEHWQLGNAAFGTATARVDGFGCWVAGPEGGVITTVPLEMEWASWPQLNVDATDGEIRVEILTEEGKLIEGCSFEDCQPIHGDHLRAVVKFGQRRGTFVRHTGRVRLRFHLRNARLYAVRAQNIHLPDTTKLGTTLNQWL